MDCVNKLFKIGYPHSLTGEYVMTYHEVLQFIKYIKTTTDTYILGGDVLNRQDEYIYANWYYKWDTDISPLENIKLSCDKAEKYISTLDGSKEYHYIVVLNTIK